MSKTSMDFSKPKGRYSNNVISSIRMNCVKNREMPALICEDRTVSWEQMWDRTARLANGLMDLGMAKGDRLAIFLKTALNFPKLLCRLITRASLRHL